jgi:hypothetical protein
VCADGTTYCSAAAIHCSQNVLSSAEVCDGVDNNCNGSVDEGCYCTDTVLHYPNTIAYDVRTTQLSAVADYSQGTYVASHTVDGVLGESFWAVDPLEGQDHYILWKFTGGPKTTNAIQIVNDTHNLHPHNLMEFDIDYTTDPNPTLSSNFQMLNITSYLNFAGTSFADWVWVDTPSQDYRVFYTPVQATGIRLHTYPNSGNYTNNNFVLTEVSFRSIAANCFP